MGQCIYNDEKYRIGLTKYEKEINEINITDKINKEFNKMFKFQI